MIFLKAIILIMPVCWTFSSPVPEKKEKEIDAKVLYDQRQEGEWNVRAHLDNFIIMIIPSQTMQSSTATPTLLDFLTKSFSKGSYLKRIKHVKKQKPDPLQEETMHFIESKTAPYHVDLSKTTNIVTPSEDVLLASSPSINVVKPERTSARVARHYVLTIPEDEYVFSKHIEPKSAIKKHKKTIKEKSKLLDAEHEQCSPGMVRDSYGICQVLKH